MTFDELEFDGAPFVSRAVVFFANGFGASVVIGKYTYGGDQGLYELGVLAGDAKEAHLTYETPVTDDVLGHLTPEQVTATLQAIEALAPNPDALPNAIKRIEVNRALLGLIRK